jgi:hypothetical protein
MPRGVPRCPLLMFMAQAMGYHPAAVRLFAEWSYCRLLKCGVKFSAPPYRTAAADAQSVSEAANVLQEWRQFGRSMTMQDSGDGALAAYDGMRSAARINLHEMQRRVGGARQVCAGDYDAKRLDRIGIRRRALAACAGRSKWAGGAGAVQAGAAFGCHGCCCSAVIL